MKSPEDINVLIGCETSGAMREAFLALGFNAFSRDLLPELQATNRLTPPKKGTQEYKDWSAIHRAPPGPNRWKIRRPPQATGSQRLPGPRLVPNLITTGHNPPPPWPALATHRAKVT